MTLKSYDFSGGDTEEKEFKNLLATTANAAVKGLYYGTFVAVPKTVADGTFTLVVGAQAVPGVKLGDMVLGVSLEQDLFGMQIFAYTNSLDRVAVALRNASGSPHDLLAVTGHYLVAKIT